MNRTTQFSVIRLGVVAAVLAIAVGAILAFAGTSPLGWTPPAVAGPFTPFVVIFVAAVGGWLSLGRLRSRYWTSAGRQAGLAAESGGLFGSTSFSGTVDGREVRVHLHQVASGKGLHTVVRALLDGPADDGAVVDVTDGRTVRAFEVAEQADVEVDGLAAAGGSRAVAEAVVTDGAGEALRAIGYPGQVFVGDASRAYEDLERLSGSDVGDPDLRLDVEQHYTREDDPTGEPLVDAASVTHVTSRQVLDGDELRRQVEAVVAVADAFERAAGTR
jgi:hypothetical protein